MLRLLSVFFIFLLASCSTMRSSHKIDAAYDFTQAKSYTWASPAIHSSVQKLDQKFYSLVKKTITDMVSNSMGARGYGEKATDGDLIVQVDLSTYSNAVVQKVQLEDDSDGGANQEIKRFLIKVIIKDKATKATVFESEVSDIMSEKKNRINKFKATIFHMMEKMPKNK